ncbi:MAG: 2Fe-2S iron-sulfur cluster binding domain-containing protein [Magnetococcales bacterium]|nr:2Fe-2S iron-sulfur cluster binding domain-containing protein [Magnetococcales bacterium]MBF0157851.1 2Fe-2S iron-sulfur cluster binding domain-containing protein [Magnetococcales bacterium]
MPKVTFLPMNRTVEVAVGRSLLEAAHDEGIPLEGACEGSLACSTCHVVVGKGWFDCLKPASEDEEDTLDSAFGVTPTSRLGCQIVVEEGMDGLVVTIPEYTTNIQAGKLASGSRGD